MRTDPRIDTYIEKAQPFARPILQYLRALVHEVCPEVEETIKWGFPHFQYKGILCSMASFKAHCVFGFRKAALMQDPVLMENARGETAMGHLGKITSLHDLPSKQKLKAWIREAVALNEQGVPLKKNAALKKDIPVPDDLLQALAQNPAARQTFEAFTPGCKREYLEWITEAKTAATRNKRMMQAIEWMAEGKKRNWKYEQSG